MAAGIILAKLIFSSGRCLRRHEGNCCFFVKILNESIFKKKLTIAQIDKITVLAKAYSATRLILFGSAAEKPEEAKDIDIACDGTPGWKLFEFAARLEDELGTLLDVVPLTPSTSFTKYVETKGKVLI